MHMRSCLSTHGHVYIYVHVDVYICIIFVMYMDLFFISFKAQM